LSKARPDEPDILEDGPIEELEAIVKSLYAHLKTIKQEMNADHNTSATLSMKKKYNVLSIYEMAHRILFGEPPVHGHHTDINSSSTGGCERLALLAHQLHLDLKLATEVARQALDALKRDDEVATLPMNLVTPKAVHF
jgi:hypothetical protein